MRLAIHLAGMWTMKYTMSFTFVDRLLLNTILTSDPNSEGGYYVFGKDEFGGDIVGCHWPEQGFYMVVNPGTLIDRVYVFNITGEAYCSGFHMLYSHIHEKWSDRYNLLGTKTKSTILFVNNGLEVQSGDRIEVFQNPAIGLAKQQAARDESMTLKLDSAVPEKSEIDFMETYRILKALISQP